MPVVAAEDMKAEEPTDAVAPAERTAIAESEEEEDHPKPKPAEVLEEKPAMAVANDDATEAGECALMPCRWFSCFQLLKAPSLWWGCAQAGPAEKLTFVLRV